jgi:hypothetical protein
MSPLVTAFGSIVSPSINVRDYCTELAWEPAAEIELTVTEIVGTGGAETRKGQQARRARNGGPRLVPRIHDGSSRNSLRLAQWQDAGVRFRPLCSPI